VAQRRLNKAAQNGWHVVPLAWSGIDLLDPMLHAASAYNCQNYPGWFCDEALRGLMAEYAGESDAGRARDLADRIQARVHDNVNMIIAGQMTMPQARRADLTGAVSFAYPILWNLRRNAGHRM
jgi:peptide/nickel transport system substrate-binding protein